MAKTLDPNAIATKWQQRASAATSAYTSGAQNPKADWATATAAAEPNYDAGVQQAISRKAFSNGAKKAGTASWQAGITNKGATRYGPGVTLGQNKYATDIAPYLQTISSTLTTLPARGPSGSAQNIQRVQTLDTALAAKKASIQSGGS